MIDLSRLTEVFSGLVGNLSENAPRQESGVLEMLQQAGLDASAFAELSQTEIAGLLAEHGIDPTQLLPGELHEFAPFKPKVVDAA